MEFEGHAKDQAALSAFVQRLFAEADIEKIRVRHSSPIETGIEFLLAIVVVMAEESA